MAQATKKANAKSAEKKSGKAKKSNSSKAGSQTDEAQELLAQMQAKKDADICPFC